MGRNNTKAVKNIAKMYEQLGLAQDDIFHKTKLLLSIYRDVVWATLADCNCVNEEIYYYHELPAERSQTSGHRYDPHPRHLANQPGHFLFHEV